MSLKILEWFNQDKDMKLESTQKLGNCLILRMLLLFLLIVLSQSTYSSAVSETKLSDAPEQISMTFVL